MSLAIYAGFARWGTSGIILGPIAMLLLGVVHGTTQPLPDLPSNNAESEAEKNDSKSHQQKKHKGKRKQKIQ